MITLSAYVFVRCLCPLTPPEKVSYEGHGELCIFSVQRLAYHGCEYSLLKGNSNYPLYYFFGHYKIIIFQLPGRATSFDSQGSCPSPKPTSTP